MRETTKRTSFTLSLLDLKSELKVSMPFSDWIIVSTGVTRIWMSASQAALSSGTWTILMKIIPLASPGNVLSEINKILWLHVQNKTLVSCFCLVFPQFSINVLSNHFDFVHFYHTAFDLIVRYILVKSKRRIGPIVLIWRFGLVEPNAKSVLTQWSVLLWLWRRDLKRFIETHRWTRLDKW